MLRVIPRDVRRRDRQSSLPATSSSSWSPEELAVCAELGEPPPLDDEVAHSVWTARYLARLCEVGVPGVSGSLLWAEAARAAEYAAERAAAAGRGQCVRVDLDAVSAAGDAYEEALDEALHSAGVVLPTSSAGGVE